MRYKPGKGRMIGGLVGPARLESDPSLQLDECFHFGCGHLRIRLIEMGSK